MKKHLILLLVLPLIIIGCKKYEDGPLISLRTKETRLVGNWNSENDSIKTKFSFEKNGSFEQLVYSTSDLFKYSKKGNWKFTDKKENITVDWTLYSTNGFNYSGKNGKVIPDTDTIYVNNIIIGKTKYKIFRLTMKELWIGDESGIGFKCTNK